MIATKITGVRVIDLRFPTSREGIGSDAVNTDPDYSAAYCILEIDTGHQAHGLTFTLGRGTDLVVQALEYLTRYVIGRSLAGIAENLCAFSRTLTDDTQFRWLGRKKASSTSPSEPSSTPSGTSTPASKASRSGSCLPTSSPNRSSAPSTSATSTTPSAVSRHSPS